MAIKIVQRCARPLIHRPHLLAAVILGLVLYFALQPWVARGITRVLLGWDGGIILFCFFRSSTCRAPTRLA